MVVIVHVPQAVGDHGVLHLVVAHAGAPAGGGEGVGGGGHILHAAGHDDLSVAAGDGPAGLNDRLHAGAAHHAHRVGGDGGGHAGLQSGLAGGVLAQAGGEDAAEHDLVHVLRLHIGPVQGLLDDGGAQLGGGGVLQGPAEGADGGAAAVDDINFSHDVCDLLKFYEGAVARPG